MEYRRIVESARTLVLVAMILQIVFILLASISWLVRLGIAIATSSHFEFLTTSDLSIPAVALFIFWVLINYYILYKPIAKDEIELVVSPALALGILELILGGIVPGILILVAHSRMERALYMKEKGSMR